MSIEAASYGAALAQIFEQTNVTISKGVKEIGLFTETLSHGAKVGVGTFRGFNAEGLRMVTTMSSVNAKMIQFTAQQQALKNMGNHLVTVGKNWQWIGRNMTAGVSLPLLLAGTKAIKTYLDYEKELVRVAKVYGSGPSEFANAKKDVEGLINSVGHLYALSRTTTANMTGDWAAMGYTIQSGLEGVVKETARVATLGEVDLQTAQENVRAIIATYSRGLAEASQFSSEELTHDMVSQLNAIENATSITFQELASSLPKVAASAKIANLDLAQTASILADMREHGVAADRAAQALNVALSRLTAVKKASDTLNQFNLAVFDKDGKRKAGIVLLKEMGDRIAGLQAAAREKDIATLFGGVLSPRQTSAMAGTLMGLSKQIDAVNEAVIQNAGSNKALSPDNFEGDFAKGLVASGEYMKEYFGAGVEGLIKLKQAAKEGNEQAQGILQSLGENAKKEMDLVLQSAPAKWERFKSDIQQGVINIGAALEPLGEFVLGVANKITSGLAKIPPIGLKVGGAFGLMVAAAGPLIAVFGQLKQLSGVLFLVFANLRDIKKVKGLEELTTTTQNLAGGFNNMLREAVASGTQIQVVGDKAFGAKGVNEKLSKSILDSIGIRQTETEVLQANTVALVENAAARRADAEASLGKNVQKIDLVKRRAAEIVEEERSRGISGGRTGPKGKIITHEAHAFNRAAEEFGGTSGFATAEQRMAEIERRALAARTAEIKAMLKGRQTIQGRGVVSHAEKAAHMARLEHQQADLLTQSIAGQRSEYVKAKEAVALGSSLEKNAAEGIEKGVKRGALRGRISIISILKKPFQEVSENGFVGGFKNLRKGGFKGLLGAGAGVEGAVGAGASLLPVIGIALALAAAVAAIIVVVRALRNHWDTFVAAAKPGIDKLKAAFNELKQPLQLFQTYMKSDYGKQFAETVGNAVSKVAEFISRLIRTVKPLIESVVATFMAAFSAISGDGKTATVLIKIAFLDLVKFLIRAASMAESAWAGSMKRMSTMLLPAGISNLANWAVDKVSGGTRKVVDADIQYLNEQIKDLKGQLDFKGIDTKPKGDGRSKPKPRDIIPDNDPYDANDKANEFLSALKSRVDRIMDKIKDKMLKAFDEMAEARIKTIDDQLAAIDALEKKEQEELENQEYITRRKELLKKQQLDTENYNRNRSVALYEGRVDDVRQLDLAQQRNLEDSQKEITDLDDEHGRLLVRRQRDLQRTQLNLQKDALQKQLATQRTALEEQLDLLKEYTPRNVAELQSRMDQMGEVLRSAGVDWKGYGTTAAENWSEAMKDAAKDMADSAFWAGKQAGIAAEAGVNQEDQPELEDKPKAPQYGSNYTSGTKKLGGWASGSKHHTGGQIFGPPKGDVPATLQEGEFVIQRSSVDKFGSTFFSMLNKGILPKFHGGGFVDNFKNYVGSKVQDFIARLVAARGPGVGNLDLSGIGPKSTVKGDPGYWRKIAAWLSMDGIPYHIMSTFRPGSITARGTKSLHSVGKAVDLTSGNMMQIWSDLVKYQDQLSELFYSPAPFGIKNGKRIKVTGTTLRDHYNHVHAAVFDKGGLLGNNSIAINKSGKSEFVLTNEMMKNFSSGIIPLAKALSSGGFVYPRSTSSTTSAAAGGDGGVTMYVETFIGQKAWFEAMMKEYNVVVAPAKDRAAGATNRVITSYKDQTNRSRR